MVSFQKGVNRVYDEVFQLLKDLGYEHVKNTGKYKAVRHNEDRVVLFAHQGFGLIFLSTVLGIPYPIIANHFDMCYTGITAIEFKEQNGYAIPKLLMLSSDSHLYREGLPTKYNNSLYV